MEGRLRLACRVLGRDVSFGDVLREMRHIC